MAAVIQREDIHTRPRALVVDDSRIARYVLYGLLDRLGFEVDLADSAELAVKRLGMGLPDVVFMDHLLPGIDGLECVRRLRAQPRSAKLPIVMYTSQDTDAFAEQAKAAGADDVFFKTGETKKLNEILRRLDLLPAQAQASDAAKVVPMPRNRAQTVERDGASTDDIGRIDLLHGLEPLIQAQHEKLRQDLLAEFVILERYEERMRSDLFARLETTLEASNARLERAVQMRRHNDAVRQRKGRGWRNSAIAASCIVMLTAGLVAGLTMRPGVLEAQAASDRINAALETQAAALAQLGRSVKELRTHAVAPAIDEPGSADAPVPKTDAIPPDAATALITELQSMGILGQVRIETSAGAFCIRANGDRFMLEPAGQALQDCEVLPLYTAGLLR
ncbi:response regulator [Lentisalinibacter salinarum]|uniref:response regulator n=1 Tax=Lentisalinibacter salinarum TaxID=2992239 RepID=UPI00386CA3D1